MNRSFYIILTPVILVAVGYILIFRAMKLPVGYTGLAVVAFLFAGAAWWLARRSRRKSGIH